MSREHRAALWEKEFAAHGIPSSQRAAPTGSLVAWLDGITPPARGAIALDLGCGFGRNSLELARRGYRVRAFDLTPACVAATQMAAREAGVADQIDVYCADLGEPWPEAAATAALAIDCFCFKHIIAPEGRAHYVAGLARALGVSGRLFLSCASIDDGYYGALPQTQDGAGGVIVIDPANGIASRLYRQEDLADVFGPLGVAIAEKRSRNAMHGRLYDRVTWLVTRT